MDISRWKKRLAFVLAFVILTRTAVTDLLGLIVRCPDWQKADVMMQGHGKINFRDLSASWREIRI